jgi:hypothetical protein
VTIVTRPYDQRLHRVAYPQRAAETDQLGSRADLDALLATTNVIEQHRAGERHIVPTEDDYVGAHREYVLAPFAYRSPSRFSDGTFGVLYASESWKTSIREAAYWAALPYGDARAPAQEVRRQCLTLRIVAEALVDVRGSVCLDVDPGVYDKADYTISRRLGGELRALYAGLVYDSVRDPGGINVGAFVPRVISDARLEFEIALHWDGTQFVNFKTTTPIWQE